MSPKLAHILLRFQDVQLADKVSADITEEIIKEIREYDEAREKQFQERDRKLTALEAWGVDNWEGYSEAMRDMHKDEDDED